jgi:hypothetical protein
MFELLATQRLTVLAPRTAQVYGRWALNDPARAAAVQQAGSGFFAALAREDASIGPDLARAVGAVSIELGEPQAIELDPSRVELLLDRSGCARTVLDTEHASHRARARMLELGFDDTPYIGYGTNQHLSALLPTSWPPATCEVLFYVIESGNSPNGIPFGPSTKAWIIVDLETGAVRSGLYDWSVGVVGPSRVPDHISPSRQDQIFAMIGRTRPLQPELVARYLADLSPSELNELARWHPGLVDALRKPAADARGPRGSGATEAE